MPGIPPIITDERPWGNFRQFCHNEKVTVKIITVMPGQKLSVQRHEHRDELWVALEVGLRADINGWRTSMLPEQEVWIPRGAVHTVENRSGGPARFLEVAFGDFDENDIERLEDIYGRK